MSHPEQDPAAVQQLVDLAADFTRANLQFAEPLEGFEPGEAVFPLSLASERVPQCVAKHLITPPFDSVLVAPAEARNLSRYTDDCQPLTEIVFAHKFTTHDIAGESNAVYVAYPGEEGPELYVKTEIEAGRRDPELDHAQQVYRLLMDRGQRRQFGQDVSDETALDEVAREVFGDGNNTAIGRHGRQINIVALLLPEQRELLESRLVPDEEIQALAAYVTSLSVLDIKRVTYHGLRD